MRGEVPRVRRWRDRSWSRERDGGNGDGGGPERRRSEERVPGASVRIRLERARPPQEEEKKKVTESEQADDE